MLVLGIVLLTGLALAIVLQPIIDAIRNINDELPHLGDQARHSELGGFINGGSNSLDTLRLRLLDGPGWARTNDLRIMS